MANFMEPSLRKSKRVSNLKERQKRHERRKLKLKLRSYEDIEPSRDSESVSQLFQNVNFSV